MKNNTKADVSLKGIILFLFLIFQVIIAGQENNSSYRQKISLNGVWDFKWDNERRLAYPPEDNEWIPIEVKIISEYETGFGKDGSHHWAWYKRKISVPESMKGDRIKVRFASVRQKAIVYWNGEKVGEHSDGYVPFEIDVTDKVDFNNANELLVGVIDRVALQRPDVLPYTMYEFGMEAGKAPLSPPFSTLLGPVYRTERTIGGICDNVDLVSYPNVYVEDFLITTSVRHSRIMVEVDILNESKGSGNYETSILIEDKGKTIKEFPKQPVFISSNKNAKVIYKDEWKNPHYWSHEDPYLYTMVFRVYDKDKIVDEKKFRFGFREFWIEGKDFYLNGIPFKIRRNHFNYGRTYEDAKEYMTMLKSINVNQIRLHHRAAPEWILSMADEMGMTLCPESAFYSRTAWYDIDNPKMWENARVHWAGIVKSARNHPSVLMYSIENEMHSTGRSLKRKDPAKWDRYENNWIKLGQFVRTLDPTRPIQYSWGGDAEGYSEVINIHYPKDIKYYFQYPNDLYWLEHENFTEKERGGFDDFEDVTERDDYWKKDKPLIVGEFGYWYHCNPPHGLTSFIGEEAYVGNNWYKTWRWALQRKYQAYKYSGVTANPYIFSNDRRKIYPLQEVFLKNWQSNFYGGETLQKEVIILNESYSSKSFELIIKLAGKNKVYYDKKVTVKMAAGTKAEEELTIKLPSVENRINAELKLSLISGGKEVALANHPVNIFPVKTTVASASSATGTIALYDPKAKTKRELTYSGFAFTEIENITSEQLAQFNVLIFGKDAVDLELKTKADIINKFVEDGGRLIMLEQTQVNILDWLPFQLEMDPAHSSTIAFNAMPDHPIMNGIEKDDLRYWRGNHQLSQNNFIRPKFWNFTTVSYAGGGTGIEHTPLVTLSYGKGLFTFSQFLISERMSQEPTAYILFNNMLKYSIDYKPSFSKAGILADDKSPLLKTLTTFGADVERIKNFNTSDLKAYDILFLDNAIDLKDYKSGLEEFLNNGGRVVLRELTPENFGKAKELLPNDVSLEPIPEIEYLKTDGVAVDLNISYIPTLDMIKVDKYNQSIADLTPWINGNKIDYPMDWDKEPEMSELLCPMRTLKTEYNPLLAGITNSDLYWRSDTKYLSMFGDEIAPIASYVVTGKSFVPLLKPGVIGIVPVGKGEIIIDQINWRTGLKKVTDKTCRIISNFLNNLNIRLRSNISYNSDFIGR